MSYQDQQALHSIERFLERFGEMLDLNDYYRMCDQISLGNAKFVIRSGKDRGIYLVNYHNRQIPCIYDYTNRTIATFMNRSWFKNKVEMLTKKQEWDKMVKDKQREIDTFFKKYQKEQV